MLLDKIKIDNTPKASRKIRAFILLFLSIAISTGFSIYIMRFNAYSKFLLFSTKWPEEILPLVEFYHTSLCNELLIFSIQALVVTIIILIVSITLFSECFILINGFFKKRILKNWNKKYDEVEKRIVKKTYMFIQLYVLLFLLYLVYFLIKYNSDLNGTVAPNKLIYAFVILALISTGTELLLRNLKIRKLSFPNKQLFIGRVIKYDILKVFGFTILIIVALNILIPLLVQTNNNGLDTLNQNLNESYDRFINIKQVIKENSNNYVLDNFKSKIIDKLNEIKLDSEATILQFSSLILFTVLVIFTTIIFIPKIEFWGIKKGLILVSILVGISIISEVIIKFLYVKENFGNNTLLLLVASIIIFFVVNELSDLIKDEIVPEDKPEIENQDNKG